MAIANTLIRLKKSGVSGNVPSSLEYGELGLNYADGKLFYKKPDGSIAAITSNGTAGGATTSSFATLNVNSTLILATTPNDILTLKGSGGINVSGNSLSKSITVDDSNTIRLAQAAFDKANTVIGAAQGFTKIVTPDGSYTSSQNTAINLYGSQGVNIKANNTGIVLSISGSLPIDWGYVVDSAYSSMLDLGSL
jgi:hypothetical protein